MMLRKVNHMPKRSMNLKAGYSEATMQADSGQVCPGEKAGDPVGERFRDLYFAARGLHGDLVLLPETILANIAGELRAGKARGSSALYALAVLSSTLITLVLTPLFHWLVSLALSPVQVVGLLTSNSQRLDFIWHPLLTVFPCVLAASAAVPLFFRQFPSLRLRLGASRLPRYDGRNLYTRRMLFAVIYIDSGAAMLWIAKLWVHGSSVLSSLILIWAAMPFFAFLILGPARMSLLIIAPIVDRERASVERLAYSLLEILGKLDGLETLSLLPAHRRRWLAESVSIHRQSRWLYGCWPLKGA